MKLVVVGLLLFLATAVYPQGRTRIAKIDSDRFDEKIGGIDRYNRALELLFSTDTECTFRCYKLGQEANQLKKEVDDLKRKNQPLDDRRDRLQKIESEHDRLKSSAKATFQRMESLLIEPVTNEIREMLKKFAAERGYEAIVDKGALLGESPVLIGGENVPDVTSEFVKFCNAAFERKGNK